MYTKFQLAKKYIRYYLSASNGKGHGVHSPFVFDFIKFVLNDKKHYPVYDKAEGCRKQLLKDEHFIDVNDFGAGSSMIKTKKRKINDIAASSLKPKKYSRIFFRMIQYYHLKKVLELGTSFGISTAYMASAENKPAVTTMEGAPEIAAIARQNFSALDLDNIVLVVGNFDDNLPAYLQTTQPDLIFIDGNHRKGPTLQYFEQLVASSHNDTILVFDDIHWSKGMEEAWILIQRHPAVTLSIDLFFIGIVFFRREFKVKQHFNIRF